jgi:hypothetical protein
MAQIAERGSARDQARPDSPIQQEAHMRLTSKLATLAVTCALLALLPASAAAAGGPFFSQGFESDTSGWCDEPASPCDGVSTGTINRVPSGYTNGGGYADGVASAAGAFHARLRTPSGSGCMPGMPGSQCNGPYSDMGLGFTDAQFPQPGYVTQLDVYLDTGFAAAHHDYRYDLESAINNTSGSYLQGFDFNAGTTLATATTPGFVIGASTNADRSGAFPENPCPAPFTPPANSCRAPVTITTPGWYTFRHTFRDVSGALTVRLQILNSTGATVPGADWTITSEHPVSEAGGPTLLWFPNQEINDLAIDNTLLRPLQPRTKADCKNGHWREFKEPSFKNQGDCVSFVATGGKNPPGAGTHKHARHRTP